MLSSPVFLARFSQRDLMTIPTCHHLPKQYSKKLNRANFILTPGYTLLVKLLDLPLLDHDQLLNEGVRIRCRPIQGVFIGVEPW